MIKQLVAPIYVQWEVTPLCNFKCIHCYNAWRRGVEKEYTTNVDLYPVITNEIIKNRIFHVTITGGEPLLVFEDIKPYLIRLHKANITMSINTNATFVTENLACELRNVGVTHALVSVPCGIDDICDDITQHHNSLKQIIKGIEILIKSGIIVSVNMVVTQKNINNIYMTAEKLKEIPILRFGATRASSPCEYEKFNEFRISRQQTSYMFTELMRIEKELNIKTTSFEAYPYCSFETEAQFKKFGKKICSAGKAEVAISYNGEIKPCAHVNKAYGHVENGLKKAWYAMDHDWRQEINIPQSCNECIYREACTGGCRQEAFSCFGSYNALDPMANPICLFRHTIIEQNTSISDVYVLNPSLRMRKEKDGVVLLFVNVMCWLLVKEKLARFLLEETFINVKGVMDSLKIDKDIAVQILKQLEKKEIIMKGEK